MITITLIITGVATIYVAPIHEPLCCDHGLGLVFGPRTPPGVAVDRQILQSGHVRRGDGLWLSFGSPRKTLHALALDAGPYPHEQPSPAAKERVRAGLKTARQPVRGPQEGAKEQRPLVPRSRQRTARRPATTDPHESHGRGLTPMIPQHGVVKHRKPMSHYQMLWDMVGVNSRLINHPRSPMQTYRLQRARAQVWSRTPPRRFLQANKGETP